MRKDLYLRCERLDKAGLHEKQEKLLWILGHLYCVRLNNQTSLTKVGNHCTDTIDPDESLEHSTFPHLDDVEIQNIRS